MFNLSYSRQKLKKRKTFQNKIGSIELRIPQGNYMPSVKIRPNESFDVGLRKFKRACEKAGIIPEVRKREFYEKPTSVLKRKKAAAVKREQKNQRKNRLGRPPRF